MNILNEDINENRVYFTNLVKNNPENSNLAGSWGGVPQDFRYRALCEPTWFFNDTSILEIGCGTGGFLEYLKNNDIIKNSQFCGIDIVKDIQAINEKKFPDCEFRTMDILREDIEKSFDIVVFCGVFNRKTPNGSKYMYNLLRKGFQYCKRVMCFNFISTIVSFKDNDIEYHDPAEVLRFCLQELSPKIELYHHYSKCDVSCRVYK